MTDLGGDDLSQLLAQVQQLQTSLEHAKEESADIVYEGSAGGGAVTISVTGEHVFTSVHIDPAIVDKQGVDLLEDVVLAALHDATEKVQAAQKAAVGNAMTSALSGLFGSVPPDLPAQFGLDDDNDTTDH